MAIANCLRFYWSTLFPVGNMQKGTPRSMDNDEAEDRTFEKALSARNKNQPKLMDDVRNKFRMLHRGKRTEEAYVGWIRRYLLFAKAKHGQK
jgi:hypothetical protein